MKSARLLLVIAGVLRAQAPCIVTPPTANMIVKRGSAPAGLSTDPRAPEWREATSAWIVKDCSRTLDYPNLKTEVKGFWTDTDLHLLFVCPYETLNIFLPADN